MSLKSSFKTDLKKEKDLSVLLDVYYAKYLKHYTFKRVHDQKNQLDGVDLVLTHTLTKKEYIVDEKAQLDYINEDLPTFAFELNYHNNGTLKKGWLFDTKKKTQFYALATAIYSDEPEKYTSCKITFVNREKLIHFLSTRNISEETLKKYIEKFQGHHGKIKLKELHDRNEGYLYYSTKNKSEKPLNLILKLDFLIQNGIAKRLI